MDRKPRSFACCRGTPNEAPKPRNGRDLEVRKRLRTFRDRASILNDRPDRRFAETRSHLDESVLPHAVEALGVERTITTASSRLIAGNGVGSVQGYTIQGLIGRGGMAEVLLASPKRNDKRKGLVAIKRILPQYVDRPEYVQMFDREAAIASRLAHPNIARVFDYTKGPDERLLVMEYVHGRPLSEILKAASRSNGLPMGVALSIVRDVAEALHYVHDLVGDDGESLGLIHRDVSPANVLIRNDGVVKLVDFGIAKSAATTGDTIVGGPMKGNLGYMAPEQCQCMPLDRRCDIYSLGVLLYEATLGRRAFRVDNEFATMEKIVHGRLERPRSLQSSYPTDLEAIVLRALAPKPDERFPTARALALALEGFAKQHQISLSTHYVAFEVDRLVPMSPAPGGTSSAQLPTTSRSPSIPKTTTMITTRRRDVSAAVLGASVASLAWVLAHGFGGTEPLPPAEPSQPSISSSPKVEPLREKPKSDAVSIQPALRESSAIVPSGDTPEEPPSAASESETIELDPAGEDVETIIIEDDVDNAAALVGDPLLLAEVAVDASTPALGRATANPRRPPLPTP